MNKEYVLDIKGKIQESELTKKEFADLVKMNETRLNEILAGNEPTVEEFINIGVALGKNLAVLGNYFIEDQHLRLNTLYDLKKSIEKQDVQAIAYLLVTNGIIVKEKEVFLTNISNKVNKKLDDEVLYGIYDLLLKSNRYDLLKRMPRVFEILNIASLGSLEKYPVACVYNFIYGTKDLKKKSINTMNFINKDIKDILFRLDYESKKAVIQNLIQLYRNYFEAVEENIKNGGYLSTFGNYIFIDTGKRVSSKLTFLDLDGLEGFESEKEEIAGITLKLKELSNYAIDFFKIDSMIEVEKHNMFMENMREENK